MGNENTGLALELLQHQVVNATGASRTVIEHTRFLTRQLHQLFHAVGGQLLTGSPDQRAGGDHAHRGKLVQGVVTGGRQRGRHGGEGRGHQQQGVAVRRLLRHKLGTNGARGTGLVFDHKRPAQNITELLRHQAAHGVGAGTRCKRNNDFDGPLWVSGGAGLRPGQGGWHQGGQGSQGGQSE